MLKQYILIINFGNTDCSVVAKKVRENNIYSEVADVKYAAAKIKQNPPKGIMILAKDDIDCTQKLEKIPQEILQSNIPILAIANAAVLLLHSLGGAVKAQSFTKKTVEIISCNDGILTDMFKKDKCFVGQNLLIDSLPKDFTATATSKNNKYISVQNLQNNFFAIQFYPQSDKTGFGKQLFYNFLVKVCRCTQDWTSRNFIKNQIQNIKDIAGDKKLILPFSAGVDSVVSAVLAHKAVGDNLTCLLLDHGFLRKDEGKQVIEYLQNTLLIKVVVIDKKQSFLKQIARGETLLQRLQIFEKEFVSSISSYIDTVESPKILLQNTLYDDIIALGDYTQNTFDVTPDTQTAKQEFIIEPLKPLFKEEVKKIGVSFGIPLQFIDKTHFPPAGLLLQISGQITQKKIDILQKSDVIISNYMQKTFSQGARGNFAVSLLQLQESYKVLQNKEMLILLIKSIDTGYHNQTPILSNIDAKILAQDLKSKIKEIDKVVYEFF